MSTDRELLEAAAKASGIAVDWRKGVDCLCYSSSPYNEAWNPLADDGDAFRLACKLKLNIAQGDYSAAVNDDDEGEVDEAGLVRNDDERAEVVRRLIVVAAAAMAERAAVGAA